MHAIFFFTLFGLTWAGYAGVFGLGLALVCSRSARAWPFAGALLVILVPILLCLHDQHYFATPSLSHYWWDGAALVALFGSYRSLGYFSMPRKRLAKALCLCALILCLLPTICGGFFLPLLFMSEARLLAGRILFCAIFGVTALFAFLLFRGAKENAQPDVPPPAAGTRKCLHPAARAALFLLSLVVAGVAYLFGVVTMNTPMEWLRHPFDAGELLGESDVVCKARVEVWLLNAYVRVHTLSRIKGNPPDHFMIMYSPNALLDLRPGETALLFLKRGSLFYHYADPHNGKITALDASPARTFGDTEGGRLLAELVQCATSGEGTAKYDAIEQLGLLGDVHANETLASLCSSDDPAVAGLSLAAGIRLGHAPDMDTLLAFVHRETKSASDREMAVPGTDRYRLSRLRSTIFDALEQSVAADRHDGFTGRYVKLQPRPYKTGPVKKLPNFDYVAFFTKALPNLPRAEDYGFVKEAIAKTLSNLADKRSLPLIKQLMDDRDSRVRYHAMVALTRIFGEGFWPSVRNFEENESFYRTYWNTKLGAEEPGR